jgi:hypothetical protein
MDEGRVFDDGDLHLRRNHLLINSIIVRLMRGLHDTVEVRIQNGESSL